MGAEFFGSFSDLGFDWVNITIHLLERVNIEV
jgi:hypothetical protein